MIKDLYFRSVIQELTGFLNHPLSQEKISQLTKHVRYVQYSFNGGKITTKFNPYNYVNAYNHI